MQQLVVNVFTRAQRNWKATHGDSPPRCLVCRGACRARGAGQLRNPFCVRDCGETMRWASSCFALGMVNDDDDDDDEGMNEERRGGKRGVAALEERNFFGRGGEVTDDVLCLLLRWAYRDQIETVAEMQELWDMRTLGRPGEAQSEQFRRVIDDCVFPNIVSLGDAVMQRISNRWLQRFTALHTIVISERSKATGKVFPFLSHLEKLVIEEGAEVSDADMQQLARSIRIVELDCDAVTNRGFRGQSHLGELRLGPFAKHITHGVFFDIPNLRTLTLAGSYSIDDLSGCDALRTLRLRTVGSPSLVDLGVARLTNLTELSCGHEDRALTEDVLRDLVNLTYLEADYAEHGVTDAVLARMDKLVRLDLDYCQLLSDEGLVNLVDLQSLSIAGNQLVGRQPDVLPSLLRLTALDISTTRAVTGDTVRQLTSLTFLGLAGVSGTQRRLQIEDAELGELTQLRALILSHNWQITDAALTRLTRLEFLSLDSLGQVQFPGGGIPHSRRKHSGITDGCFPALISLRVLDLSENTQITGATVSLLPEPGGDLSRRQPSLWRQFAHTAETEAGGVPWFLSSRPGERTEGVEDPRRAWRDDHRQSLCPTGQ